MIPQTLIIKAAAELLLPVAEEIVESTDNTFDDTIVHALQYILGVHSENKSEE